MAFRMKINIREKAREDLLEIWHFIAHIRHNLQAADALMSKFELEFQRISANPNIGTLATHLNGELRQRVLGSYLIFYQAEFDSIYITRILHSSRNLPTLL